MTDVEKSELFFVVSTIFGTLLNFTLFRQFTLFCRKIGLLRFTRYCVEKILAKNSARGEKMANIRYVTTIIILIITIIIILIITIIIIIFGG